MRNQTKSPQGMRLDVGNSFRLKSVNLLGIHCNCCWMKAAAADHLDKVQRSIEDPVQLLAEIIRRSISKQPATTTG
jgi:hypothetical protein